MDHVESENLKISSETGLAGKPIKLSDLNQFHYVVLKVC